CSHIGSQSIQCEGYEETEQTECTCTASEVQSTGCTNSEKSTGKDTGAWKMMNTKEIKRLVILNIPYVILGLLATNLGEAWRLAAGTDISEKILALFGTIPAAFGNPLPSMRPADLCVGLVCGAVLRTAVYLRGKNAKKYRHNVEYGSARWGTAKDIEPFIAPKFEDNVILTKTEL